MNQVLVHELEHVAQIDRRDRGRVLGHIGMLVLTVIGVIIGYRLALSWGWLRIPVGLIGALIGQRLGYQIAPQERQARQRARSMTTTAISR